METLSSALIHLKCIKPFPALLQLFKYYYDYISRDTFCTFLVPCGHYNGCFLSYLSLLKPSYFCNEEDNGH